MNPVTEQFNALREPFVQYYYGILPWSGITRLANGHAFSHPLRLAIVLLSDLSNSQFHINGSRIIDPPVASFIEETIALENITGLSVTVIPKRGEPELRAWGYRMEEGDAMTPGVSPLILSTT